jgi:HEAT repeat protein
MKYPFLAALVVIVLAAPTLRAEEKPPDADGAKIKQTVTALSSQDAAVRAKAEADLENASQGADAILKEKAVGADDELAGRIFRILEKRGTLVFQASPAYLNLPEPARDKYYFWKLCNGTAEEKTDSLWALWNWEKAADKMYEPALKFFREPKTDANAKRAAIQVLALLKNPAAIPVFVEAATFSDNAADKAATAARSEAVNGLGNIASSESAKELRKILEKEKESPLTGPLILALGRSAGPADLDELKPFLKSSDARVRVSAIRALVESGSAIASAEILPLISDNDAAVRAWVAFALSASPDVKAEFFFEKAKQETDPKSAFVKDMFKIAAFRQGGDVPADEIRRLLKMNYADVRLAAAIALLERGDLAGLGEFDKRLKGDTVVTMVVRVLKGRIPELPALPSGVLHDAEQKARLEIRAWLKANAPTLKWDAEKRVYTKPK